MSLKGGVLLNLLTRYFIHRRASKVHSNLFDLSSTINNKRQVLQLNKIAWDGNFQPLLAKHLLQTYTQMSEFTC